MGRRDGGCLVKRARRFQRDVDGTRSKRQLGWFVGWVERDDAKFVFARLNKEDQPQSGYAGSRTKESMLRDLNSLVGMLQ